MIKLLKYLKPYRGFAAASVFLVLVSNILQLVNPLLTEQMINEGIQMADPDKILQIGTAMLTISAVNIVISVLNTYCNAKTSSGYSTLLRKAIFRKVQTLSQSDINKIGVASLITRSSNDITQVQQMVMTVLQQIIAVPVLLVGGLVMAISKSAELSKIILIIVPVILVLFLVLLAFLMPLFNKMQKKIDNLNQVIREKLSGIRVIRAFNRNQYEDERFRTANLDLTSIALKVQRIFAFMLPIAVLLVCWAGSWLEKRLRAWIKGSAEMFVTPTMTILLVGITSLVLIQPLAGWLSDQLALQTQNALKHGGLLAGAVLGGTFLPLVMMGIHQSLVPIHQQLVNALGANPLFPILCMAGAGQVGASLAVLFKTRNAKLKTIVKNALPVGLLGIGEPLIYGVTLPLFKPFIGACLGAAVGGAVVAAFHVTSAIPFGVSGVVLFLALSNLHSVLFYALGFVTSVICGFAFTWKMGFDDPAENE